jgi:hypothetical protein
MLFKLGIINSTMIFMGNIERPLGIDPRDPPPPQPLDRVNVVCLIETAPLAPFPLPYPSNHPGSDARKIY